MLSYNIVPGPAITLAIGRVAMIVNVYMGYIVFL